MVFSCSLSYKKYSSHALHWDIWSKSAPPLQVYPRCHVVCVFPLMTPILWYSGIRYQKHGLAIFMKMGKGKHVRLEAISNLPGQVHVPMQQNQQ